MSRPETGSPKTLDIPTTRKNYMKTMKTLILAGLTVLSLGAGAAMAQDGGSLLDYWGEQNLAAANQRAMSTNPRFQVTPDHEGAKQNDVVMGAAGAGT
jgi:hypothetical protein